MENPFLGKQVSLAAFTLIELVIVMAVLAILGAITIGGVSGGRGGAKLSQAKSELQVIQHGLEAYRARFGDYPRIPDDAAMDALANVADEEAYLFNALHGRIGPAHQKIDNVSSMLNSASLSFEQRELPLGDSLLNNRIVDPWGNAYEYDYRPNDASWEVFGYILYSFGPNGADEGGAGDDLVAQ